MSISEKYAIHFMQATLLVLCGLHSNFSFSQKRDKEDAMKVAVQFINQNSDYSHDCYYYANSQEPYDTINNYSADDAFYIFNKIYGNNGFVIVSGDERMPDILAYSFDNSFNMEDMPPAVKYWLDCYKEEYKNLDKGSAYSSSTTTYNTDSFVEPLLKNIRWGQGAPFNHLCPEYAREKCLTGCVATGMAQVMKYYNYPTKGKGLIDYYTHTNNLHVKRDLSNDVFVWDKMLPDYKGKYDNGNVNAVATLMANCGAPVNMDYGIAAQGGSGAMQKDLLKAYINNFHYDGNAGILNREYCTSKDWHDALIEELNEGRPINYAGHSILDGGHSFVIDGYRYRGENTYPDYHVNWGWEGTCDGYYQIANLHPKEDGIYHTSESFSLYQQMTVGIKPDDGIDNKLIRVGTKEISTSKSKLNNGDNFTIYVGKITNFSYDDYTIRISPCLVAGDGTETELAGEKICTLNSLGENSNIQINVSVPKSVDEGEYKIKFNIKDTQTDRKGKFYSSKFPTVIVGRNGTVQTNPTLGCSEMEAKNNPEDKSEVRILLYELQNLKEEPFDGELCLAITNSKDSIITTIGEPVSTGELVYHSIIPDPLRLTGSVKGYLPDGKYKLYAIINNKNVTKENYVCYYNANNPYEDITNLPPLFLTVSVQDGEMKIGNCTFSIPRKSPLGDVDGNGIINLNDALLIVDYYLGKNIDIDKSKADVNGDNKITINDANHIVNLHLKKE